MRIRVLSDLHLEFAPMPAPPVDCDVVVLAGDIHQGPNGLLWARRSFPATPVIYVPGNHEYYGHDWDALRPALAAQARALGIHLLDGGQCVLDGVRFLGCTLWTDFDLFGTARRDEAMAACRRALFDYRHIHAGAQLLHPEQTRQRHQHERDWLAAELLRPALGQWHATVVVTHMLPSERSTAERFKAQLTCAGFASGLDALVQQADVWIHGHTHDSCDYALGACRVVCNPRGYQHANRRFENARFDDRLVVQIA